MKSVQPNKSPRERREALLAEKRASSCTVDSFVRCIACDGRGMFHSKRAGAYEAICARCHGTGEKPND